MNWMKWPLIRLGRLLDWFNRSCNRSSNSDTQAPWYIETLTFGFGRRIPEVLQTETAECGLACLTMISCYYQKYIELSDLRREYPVSLKGIDLKGLISIARRQALSSRALRLELDQLHMLKMPCILHWNLNHFVVLSKVTRDHIVIIDPATGYRHLSTEVASKSFTGVALELWPNPDFRKSRSTNKTFVTVNQLLKSTTGLVPLFAETLAIALGIELLTLLTPLMTQLVVDYVVPSHDENLLVTCAVGFGLIVLIQQILTAMRSWVVMYMGTTLTVEWQANTFSHLLKLPVSYFQKRHLGDVVSRFDAIKQIQNTLTTSFITAVLDGIMSVATLVLMFVYNSWLSWISLIAIGIYVFLRIFTFSYLRGNTQSRIIFDARAQTSFLETLRGIKAIKLFQREDMRRIRWLSILVQSTNSSIATQRTTLVFTSARGLVFGFENIISLWLGAKMILSGDMTVGVLMAYISYKEQFAGRISSLTDRYFDFRMLRLQSSRLSDIVCSPPEPERTRFPLTAKIDLEPRIEVRNLSFRYAPTEPEVFNRVSFEIRSGEAVAIAGPSGCGKTTLINVLLGILRPTAGAVLIGGIDIRYLGVHSLRQMVGSVSQDDTLFAGSIGENISFFDQNPNQDWVEACAKQASIHSDILAMPMGYRTLVGDMGTVLSGGQKQRILIARALYCRPKILIFDEATSNLDPECENRVVEAIQMMNITRVIVSHRPQTIATADRVIFLDRVWEDNSNGTNNSGNTSEHDDGTDHDYPIDEGTTDA